MMSNGIVWKVNVFLCCLFSSTGVVFAQGVGQPSPTAQSPMNMLMMLGTIFLVFYFLVIRPQQKERKRHAEAVNQLQKNDRVVTAGGIHATVAALKSRTVVLKIAEGVKIEINKSAISTIISRDVPPEREDEQKSP